MRLLLPLSGFISTFLVISLALAMGACSTIGKGPRGPAYITALDPYSRTVTVVEPVYYHRAVSCRHHGNPEADGFYGCSESHQAQ
jgi:hypothetical protein